MSCDGDFSVVIKHIQLKPSLWEQPLMSAECKITTCLAKTIWRNALFICQCIQTCMSNKAMAIEKQEIVNVVQ